MNKKPKVKLVYDDSGVTVTCPAQKMGPLRVEERTYRMSNDEIDETFVTLAQRIEATTSKSQVPPDWKWKQLKTEYPKTFKRLQKAAKKLLASLTHEVVQ